MNIKDIDNLPTEGNRGLLSLCKIAEELGYVDPFRQLINNDGTCIGDLMVFFGDNPGAVVAVMEWVKETFQNQLEKEDEEEEGEEE